MAATVTRLTDSIAKSLDRLYKTGGFALAFGFAGIILMLSANLFGKDLSLARLLIGALLTFACFGFFLYSTVRGNARATKAIRDNKEAIDAVQDISIELTRLVNTLQAHGFKNLDRINKALNAAIPMLKQIPLVGGKLEEHGLGDANLISQVLVDNTQRIERIVADVEDALVNADHEKLHEYSRELSSAVVSLRERLRT